MILKLIRQSKLIKLQSIVAKDRKNTFKKMRDGRSKNIIDWDIKEIQIKEAKINKLKNKLRR